MTDEFIEIQAVPDDSQEPVRSQFRVPVEQASRAVLIAGDIRCPILEINRDGAGISIQDNISFKKGDVLENCCLELEGETFLGLKARIVHRSIDPGGVLRCGIKWSDLSERKQKQMEHLLGQMKNRALKQTDRDVTQK